jgi:restriction endonuclease S subunit
LNSLESDLLKATTNFEGVGHSKAFSTTYSGAKQWDVNAGRAAAFIAANKGFVRLGDFTEECTETVRPWETPDAEWPVYGVNNKEGVFLNSLQRGADFNAPYKRIEKDWFFHNPTRANVGSFGIVPEVPVDAITSPEYQVWRLKGGFLPAFVSLIIRTDYFLSLVAFNRMGGVKQRMYYANLADIRLPMVLLEEQQRIADEYTAIQAELLLAKADLELRKGDIEKMILGTMKIEGA